MNTEEQQLSDLLHRITPEPPRGVTVEDVAIRMANQARRQPRTFRGSPGRGRAWTPALAAASVFVVVGASAAIAVLASSHHTSAPTALSTISASSASSPGPSPARTPTSTYQPPAIPDGPWHARLIAHQALMQDSLVSGGNWLYAIESGTLDRIDPATGTIVATTPYRPTVINPPVMAGNTVWVVWAYGDAGIVLHGYQAQTLAPVSSMTVPVTGEASSTPQGILAAGPDGNLYLAAGNSAAVLDPATLQVVRRYSLPGPASSVAVSPDASTLYVGTQLSSTFRLLTFDLVIGTESSASDMNAAGVGGNLVATSGGVWGTLGAGVTEWTWFARSGHVNQAIRVGPGAIGGFASIPTLSGGAVWVGGSQTLACADPDTGAVLSTATIPADHGTLEYFGSVATVSGQAYANYQNETAEQYGLARMTPPAACTGGAGGS
jgi:hypothetical protein